MRMVIGITFLRRPGYTFAGSGAYSAANGIWLAAAPPPNNGGDLSFRRQQRGRLQQRGGANCDLEAGHNTLAARRRSPSPPEATAPSAPPEATPQASRLSRQNSGAAALGRQQRGLAAEAPAGQGDLAPGSNYALVIGIDDYAAPLPKLKTAVNDAKSFAGLLSSKYGFQVTTLLNQDATRDKILAAITHFRKSLD